MTAPLTTPAGATTSSQAPASVPSNVISNTAKD